MCKIRVRRFVCTCVLLNGLRSYCLLRVPYIWNNSQEEHFPSSIYTYPMCLYAYIYLYNIYL